MDRERARQRLGGCYVTIPTMFRDEDMELNLEAMRRHVRFLLEGGITETTGVLLAGGAAGDFSTMTLDERVRVAETVVHEASGRILVVMGAQTTSTRELVQLARAAERVGAEYIQVSPPYYFQSTEDDFYEYVLAASEAADVGLVVYNTFWTSADISMGMVDRLCELENMIGLKWSTPGLLDFERVVAHFSDRLCIIDNQLRFVTSHILGATGFELHICNFWPQWGVRLLGMLEEERYAEVQREMMDVVVPFYDVWMEMEKHTSGDGYLDKLCMELVGLGSSRCRPPTRDLRDQFRDRTREMLVQIGVPGIG
ncbi:MAG: dihydrodipicolinate synthase family protein [Candidatus Latescibacteria bacterium]|nr:dihydrodipicolinate synthase family protein [Candidatus Latescibacterota bacterium]